MAEVKVGDQVWYVAHVCHALDFDRNGARVFHFVHAKDSVDKSRKAGDHAEVDNAGVLGKFGQRDADGHIQAGDSHFIKPHRPRAYWPATVRAVNADGTCDLDVQHPNSFQIMHYPDRDPHPRPDQLPANYVPPEERPGVPHDPAKGLHSFHLEGE